MSNPGRYYMYISGPKVDMLFPKVDGAAQRKLEFKFGFDLKILSSSFATERKTYDNLIARLEAVEEDILAKAEVGTPIDIRPWIRGTLEAKFVDIGGGGILFVAREANTFLALGGSARHLIGSASPDSAISFSFLPSLIQQLTLMVEHHPEYLLQMPEEELARFSTSGVRQGFDAWVQVIQGAWMSPAPVSQRIEFLAKRLVSKATHDGEVVTLATPLYVSLSE